MGNAQSAVTENKLGFHVLLVQRASPAEEAGLETYFDFMVAVNGRRLDKDDGTLMEELKANVNKPVELVIYSSKTEQLRWARVRFCDYENANEHVWHILSHEDYVIASPDTLLHDQGAFAEQVQQSMFKPMRLYVYNRVSDSIREVTIIPDRNWGGPGSLGCDVGYGFLHRIPRPDRAVDYAPRRLLEGSTPFVGANVQAPATSAPATDAPPPMGSVTSLGSITKTSSPSSDGAVPSGTSPSASAVAGAPDADGFTEVTLSPPALPAGAASLA